MAKALPLNDFRARRFILEEDDYGLIAEAEPEPYDVVDRETWRSIQALPEEVSVFTSDLHGSLLKRQHQTWAGWIDRVCRWMDKSRRRPAMPLGHAMLDTADEFQAATFALLHGYYRQAIGGLRTALELMAVGARYQSDPKNAKYLRWKDGIGDLGFGKMRDELSCLRRLVGLNEHLQSRGMRRFAHKSDPHSRSRSPSNSWMGHLYDFLCRYAHGRPDFNHVALWGGSNGPVYDETGIKTADDLYRRTAFTCWALASLAAPDLYVSEREMLRLLVRDEDDWREFARESWKFLMTRPRPRRSGS